jgi:hypothetical protein
MQLHFSRQRIGLHPLSREYGAGAGCLRGTARISLRRCLIYTPDGSAVLFRTIRHEHPLLTRVNSIFFEIQLTLSHITQVACDGPDQNPFALSCRC